VRHLLIIIVESHAVRLEIFPASFKLRRCGSENSHKFGRRSEIEKIDGVFLANPSQTSEGNSEFRRRHVQMRQRS
jgi:hypothetical protein